MRNIIIILCMGLSIAVSSCSTLKNSGDFTRTEKKIINRQDSILRVLTIESDEDLKVLRSVSTDLSDEALNSDDFKRLSEMMIATVTHPSQDGVGLAAPQIGLNRRVVAVQRFDKDSHPFEVYPNIRIVWASETLEAGPEGCLSVPDESGTVMRSNEIIIEYKGEKGMVKDTISGFTAVIFQHEIDHLEGILYTDRIKESAE